MFKAILFDCGGVLMYPRSGSWMLPPHYSEILGYQPDEAQLSAYGRFIDEHPELLPEAMYVPGEAEEETLTRELFRQASAYAGMNVSETTLTELCRDMVYSDERLICYEDVTPALAELSNLKPLGLLSDAPPSSRRIMANTGLSAYFAAETYSFELGVIKPDPKMFLTAAERLHCAPEDVLFIDDYMPNLLGAQSLGMQGLQMRRRSGAPYTEPWDGPIVSDMTELCELLKSGEL